MPARPNICSLVRQQPSTWLAFLTFTSLGRHAGATESMTSGLTEFELMKKGVVAAQGDGQIPAR